MSVPVCAQNATVQWFTLSEGFGLLQPTGNRSLMMSAGQPFVARSTGSGKVLESGFLVHPALHIFAIAVPIAGGWNMVSNPVATANDSVHQLYPTASFPYAFSFAPGAGYVQQYRMTDGLGYWEKFPGSATEWVEGTPRLLDTIQVSPGWNMIGSISHPVDTSIITTVPPGIRASQYFGYDGGYSPAQTIVPGRAYWVKVNAGGMFVLSASLALAKPRGVPGSDVLGGFNTMTVADEGGGHQVLYFGEDVQGNFPVELFELPPPGPEGVLDARFESQGMVEVYNDEQGSGDQLAILVRSAAFPITVSWKIVDDRRKRVFGLGDGINGLLVPRKEITGEGSLEISNPAVTRLIVSTQKEPLPTEFSLAHNYPNPFNPSTTIGYTLPLPVHVELEIYDILGQEVATLVNEFQEPGFKSVKWDASSVASGVYFYRLRAGDFTASRQFLLLK